MTPSAPHRYHVRGEWSGTTAGGYDAYDRAHHLVCPPVEPALTVTADPAFRGDAASLNPEQLLLAAATSCQLLSFLAVAARARIDVRAYRDDAEADMPGDLRPMRITVIRLRPAITVAAGTDAARVHKLVALAHEQCFIANSLSCPVEVEATVEIA